MLDLFLASLKPLWLVGWTPFSEANERQSLRRDLDRIKKRIALRAP